MNTKIIDGVTYMLVPAEHNGCWGCVAKDDILLCARLLNDQIYDCYFRVWTIDNQQTEE